MTFKGTRLPSFIGIGAPKAGTTWLFRCLEAHPEVFVAAVKETNFFDYHTIEGRMDEYEVHFVGSEGFPAVGEISTRYLTSERAPGRIKEHIPAVRLFVSLRNPLDQVYSHYWHMKRQNFHQWDRSQVPDSFEEALATYGEKLLEPARYHKHLRRWLECFDREQLLLIWFEEIVQQPADVLDALYAHLGVDAAFRPAFLGQAAGGSTRRGVSPKNEMLGRIHSFLHDQLNRNVYQRLKRLMGVKRAIQVKEALGVRQIMERLFMREGYPPMAPVARSLVWERLKEDVQKLEGLTGRRLDHWYNGVAETTAR